MLFHIFPLCFLFFTFIDFNYIFDLPAQQYKQRVNVRALGAEVPLQRAVGECAVRVRRGKRKRRIVHVDRQRSGGVRARRQVRAAVDVAHARQLRLAHGQRL